MVLVVDSYEYMGDREEEWVHVYHEENSTENNLVTQSLLPSRDILIKMQIATNNACALFTEMQ